MIKNVNTIEEYKELDKMNMLQQAGRTVRLLSDPRVKHVITNVCLY